MEEMVYHTETKPEIEKPGGECGTN